ncbi:tryptophan halogenase [Plesiocystis pacifica SIR-1]|uniref:Tryptophan halogenase n=1 Tax=Plesiocystis pacifica SIR-1 TaxID=391625 RepID=A6G2J2_9BACT|nr:tryptophan halogenase [Plesiocystis pacifica SIR-1]
MLGGGSSGYFAALAIQRRFPELEVTVIASSKVPIIGVGEATTTLMPPFLHAQLGLSMEAMCRAVEPTFKLGIRFEWGRPGAYHFNFPFGDADPLLAHHFDGDLRHQSLMSMAMDQGLAPVLRGPEGEVVSLLRQVKFAYHLDNAPFVAFLAEAARAAGIGHIDATICDASTRAGASGEPEIASLRTEDGRELAYDLYIDASGFRSVLLGGALEERFQSYASSLFCDRAVVADVAEGAGVEPYTTAETMDAGWCWRIPVRRACHRGYVYSSAFQSDDEAVAHMRAANPSMGEAKLIRFRSGRRERAWVGNVAAVGNAYGFVEPPRVHGPAHGHRRARLRARGDRGPASRGRGRGRGADLPRVRQRVPGRALGLPALVSGGALQVQPAPGQRLLAGRPGRGRRLGPRAGDRALSEPGAVAGRGRPGLRRGRSSLRLQRADDHAARPARREPGRCGAQNQAEPGPVARADRASAHRPALRRGSAHGLGLARGPPRAPARVRGAPQLVVPGRRRAGRGDRRGSAAGTAQERHARGASRLAASGWGLARGPRPDPRMGERLTRA